jgi:hypothetical protein
LLELLNARVDDSVRRQKGWPRTPSRLSNRLRRIAPDLPALGLTFEDRRANDRNRTRLITLRLVEERNADSSESSVSSVSSTGDQESSGTTAKQRHQFGLPLKRFEPEGTGPSKEASYSPEGDVGGADGQDAQDGSPESSASNAWDK